MSAKDSHWDRCITMQFLVWRDHQKKYGFPLDESYKVEASSHREAAERFAVTMGLSGYNTHRECVFVALASTPEKRLPFHLEMSFKATPI